MTIDLNFTIKNIEGNDMVIIELNKEGKEVETNRPLVASDLVSRKLFNMPTKHAVKIGYWAEKLFKKEVLELDPTDAKLLKEAISSFGLGAGIEAQILSKITE